MFHDVAFRFTALHPKLAFSEAVVSLTFIIKSREILSFFLDFYGAETMAKLA
jgi:hypothetical protein